DVAHRLRTVVGLGHHLDVGRGGQQRCEPGAHQPVIVDEHHPDHRDTANSHMVPAPGSVATDSVAPTDRAASVINRRPKWSSSRAAYGSKPIPSSAIVRTSSSSTAWTVILTGAAPAWRM